MTSLTKGVVGQNNSGDQTIFEERFKYFLAKNKRNKQFIIQPIGTTSLPSDSWTSLRRDSNGSTDSGFQSATTSSSSSKDDYFFWNFNDDFNFNDNNEMNNNNMNNNNNNNIFIMERPANPLSSVLSGRRSLQSNTSISSSLSSSSDTNQQQQHNNQFYQNDEVDDGDDEDEDEDEDDQLPSNEYYMTTSPSAYNSPSIITTVSKPSLLNYPSFKSIRSTTSNLSTTNTSTSLNNNNNYNHGTLFKSESNGFFTGITKFSHEQVLQWAKEQDCCDSRLLKLQAIENKGDHSFPISQGIVNLIEPTGISIISDIDDTIKETQILHGARTVLQNTFFNETNDIPGMAEAYMKWYTQGASFHYVSNSPFQLLPFLQQFLNTSQFPPGSMHLRLDGSLLARLIEIPGRAKRDAILSIMNDFPQRQFVLVGDSGEIDLEIYTKIALEHPDRILKIFIHDITTKYAHYKQQKKIQAISTTSTSTTTYSSSSTITNNNNGLSLSSLFQTSSTSKRKSSISISTSLQQEQDNQLSNSMDDLFSITRSTTNGSSSSSSPLSSSSSSIKASSLLEMASSISSSSLLGLGRGRTKTLADLVIEPSTSTSSSTSSINNNNNDDIPPSQQCAQLYDRVKKAQDQLPSHIEIVLFQNADELRDDLTIQDALWQHWDDQC
ncbi:unnamed protein product [Cunninghamella echinulata]